MIFIARTAFILLEQKAKSNLMKKICKIEDFCCFERPSEGTKILGFNQYQNFDDKIPSIIQAFFESLIKKVNECKNNPEKSSTTKIGEHILCR